MTDTSAPSMRICHLILPGAMAGAEKVVLAGCRALLDIRQDVTLAVIRDSRIPSMAERFLTAATERKIPIYDELTSTKRVDFPLQRQMREYLNDSAFDVLHTHGYKALTYAYLACPTDTHFVHTHHGDTSRSVSTRAYQWLAYQAMRRIDGVCAVSERMHEQLSLKIPAGKLHLVENMLATSLPLEANTRSIASKDDALELVAIGRLSTEKGLAVLLRAIATMPAPQPRVTLVGEGPHENDLRSLINTLGIDELITFAGFQKNITPFLTNAHALAMPSLREGLPLSLIEATTAGLPVVASKVGGIPSVIEHGINGVLCSPDNIPALQIALQQLTECHESLKLEASQRAPVLRERFSPSEWARKTTSVYDSVASARAQGS